AEDSIRDRNVTGVQTCALPILDSTNLIVPVSHLITSENVFTVLFSYWITPFKKSPSVIPVAANIASSPFTKSSSFKTLFTSSIPISLHLLSSSSFDGLSLPWNIPPNDLIAAAAITPSGAPPIPTTISKPDELKQVAILVATSPSSKNLILAPFSLILLTKSLCLSLL